MSTRNPLHLLAGANDYRTVDIPGLPNDNEESKGDAWLGVFKSFDGGQTWRSTLLPGYPQDTTAVGKASPLYGYAAGADATMRAGTNGLFYYSGLAFNRGANGLGVLFVSRFIDNNNVPGGDPIPYLGTAILDKGTAGQFVDKPTMAVDVPRAGAGTCTVQSAGVPQPQIVPAGNVYVAYVTFMGGGPGGAKAKTPNNLVSRLLLTRSTNCGVTWSTPIKVSEGVHVNQGATLAIDPVSGAVYLAWREFIDATQPAAIHIVKSTDAGKTFSKPTLITKFRQFDQGGTKSSFRTNSYPSMSVDGTGRVYVAWAERWAAAPGGDARIVMTSSRNGVTWTPRQPVETLRIPPSTGAVDPVTRLPISPPPVGPVRGHQVMPVVSTTGGKVTVLFYDFGDDVSTIRNEWLSDGGATTATKRHTADVRVVQAAPADVPVFGPSVRVSQYLMGSRKPKAGTTPQIEQLQFNVPNLPLYSQGEMAFLGDYIDVSGVAFVQDATGKWVFNTSSTGPSEMFAFWTDNRDVRPPADGNWKNYTAPRTRKLVPGEIDTCIPGQTGMRNANIYSARITEGLLVGSPTNAKRLGQIGTRSFVVFAQNATQQTRRFRFTILNQPAGGSASFRQPFASLPGSLIVLPAVDVTLAPRSSGSRTVYVTSTDPKATVKVDVTEVDLPTEASPVPQVKTNGLQSTVVLNPDVTNPDVENPDVENPDVENPDVMNEVFNPDVENPDVTNPDVENPDVTNPDVENPDVENVQIANPDVTNPDVENPDVENPDVENPDVTNPDVENGSIIDVSWTIKNSGNTTGSFAVKPFLTKNAPAGFKKQLILHKIYTTPITKFDECEVKTQTQNVLIANVINPDVENPDVENPDVTNPDVENPDVENPDVENPDVENPDVTNATLSLEPGASARITLRVVNPDTDTYAMVEREVTRSDGSTDTVLVPEAFDPSEAVAPIVFTQAVGTEDAAAGVTQTPVVIPLVISSLALPAASATLPYFSQLTSAGGDGPRTWSIVRDVETDGTVHDLPVNLVLNPATGVIYGTPTTPGLYPFTVRVTDSAVPQHVNTQALSLLVGPAAPPVVVYEDTPAPVPTTATVNGAVIDSALGFAIASGPTSGQLGPLSGLPPAGVSAVYAPVADFNGSDAFTYNATLMTAAGPLTALGTVLLTVEPVNDVPSFTKGPDQTVLEDAGAQTVAAWATAISKGPANEVGQTLNFVVSNDNAALFAGPPAIAPDGTLSYTPAANANGSATVTVRIHDDGGVSNGGIDTSAAQTFVINVTPVNDVPSFTKGADRTVLEDSGVQTAAGWATAISVGPADEVAQTPNFIVSSSSTGLFSVQPAAAADGTLTFTPASNANGTATVTVQVHDDGGVLNGGVDTSAVQTFTITVTAVNDSPVGVNDPLSSVAEDSGARTISFASLLGNDSTGPNEGEQTLTITAVGNPVGGSVSLSGTDVLFTPAANFNGPASFTYTLQDDGTTAAAADFKTATATVSFAVVPVNDVPVSSDDRYATDEDIALVIANAATCVAKPAGLSGWWRGEGNSYDGAGTSDLTPHASVTFAAGEVGQAFSFNGNGPASAPFVQAGPFTLDFWVNPANIGQPGFTGLLSSTGNFAAAQFFQIELDGTGHYRADLGNGVVYVPMGAAVQSTWQHLTLTFDGTTVRTYLDGAPIGSALYGPALGFELMKIGENRSGTLGFQGKIDEVAVFSRALSGAEITALHVADAAGMCLGLLSNDTDLEGNALSSVIVANPTSGGVVVNADGSFTYTPNSNFNGTDSFTYKANDGVNDGNLATVNIIVAAVNDAPAFATGPNQTVTEDSVPRNVAGWATGITAGAADESAQTLDFIVANDNNALFLTPPAIAADGRLTFALAPNANGLATVTVRLHDNGGVLRGGVDTSAAQTFTITAFPVNDPPSFTKGGNQTVVEDAGPQSIAAWATSISAGPPDEGGQALDFTVLNLNQALFAVQPAISPNGTLTYTPAANASGVATVNIQLSDNGGGTNLSAATSFIITVTAVNDAPVAVGDSYTIAEDTVLTVDASGGNGLQGLLYNDSDGDAGTTLIAVYLTNPAHGTLLPHADGSFSYTPYANYAGPDSFTYQANDGALSSNIVTVTLTVTAVEDPPNFTKGADQTVAEDAGLSTIAPWATAISGGGADEPGLFDFIVSNDNNGLFSLQPSVSAAGTLTYQSAPNAFGAATVTVRLHDSNATAGFDTSTPQTFLITVTPVNDPPVAVADTVSASAGVPVSVNVLANDYDIESPVGSLVAAISAQPAGIPANLGFMGEAAVVNGTVFFANTRSIGTFNPTTHVVTSSLTFADLFTQQGSPSLSRVNTATGYVYFRSGNTVLAFNSATNSVDANLRLGGNVQSIDLDVSRGRLYVTYIVPGSTIVQGSPNQSGVAVIDVDPTHVSPNPATTFHQVLYSRALPSGVNALGVAVNVTTNKIYVGSNRSAANGGGIFVLDGTTQVLTPILLSAGAGSVAVDAGTNLVWATGLQTLQAAVEVIDGTGTNPPAIVPVPGLSSLSNIANKHLAINGTTHDVYVRSRDANVANTGNVFVIGGDPFNLVTFKQVRATIAIGSDSPADDLVVDEALNKVVATSQTDFKIVVIDGANDYAATTIGVHEPPADVALLPASHHVVVTGLFSLFDVALSGAPALIDTTPVGGESEMVAVDASLHRAYVGRNNGAASVLTLNKNGQTGSVSGVSGMQAAGRYSFGVVNPTTHRLYVLNTSANSTGTNQGVPTYVSVINTNDDSIVTTIPTSTASFGLGINPVTNKVYVGGQSLTATASVPVPATITVIDGATNTATPANTSAFDSFTSFNREFVTNTAANKIYFRASGSGVSAGVLDGATNVATPLSTSLGNVNIIKVDSALNRVYVGNDANQVYVLDGATDAVLATLSVGSPLPFGGTLHHIAVDESNHRVYVADFDNFTVTVFDANNDYAVLATLPTGVGPGAVAVNPVTHRVYVANFYDKSMTFIDGAAPVATIVGTLPGLPYSVTAMAVDAGDSRIYTTNGFDVAAGAMVLADSGAPAGLTIVSATGGAQGAVVVAANQTVIYTPSVGASGPDTFTYTISDGQASSAPGTVTVNITAPLTLAPATLPDGTSGAAYNQLLVVSGGQPPYKVLLDGGTLPGGLTLSTAGRLQGTPTAVGNYTFSVGVMDSAPVPNFVSRTYTVGIGPVTILTSNLPQATLGQPYTATLMPTGSTATTLVWSLLPGSTLPAGLALSPAGVISGTPTQSSCSTSPSFTVQVQDTANPAQTANRSFTMSFTGPIRITTTALNTGVLFENFSSPVLASCGSGNRTWTLTGALPLGESFAASAVNSPSSFGSFAGGSAQPKQNGAFPITIQVSDGVGSDSKAYTLNVLAIDQQLQSTSTTPATVPFSGTTRIAQTMSTGVTGLLAGVRFTTLSCAAYPSALTVTIQGVNPANGSPDDGQVFAALSATITSASTFLIPLPSPIFFAAGAKFAVVASTGGTCTLNNVPTTDNYTAGVAFSSTAPGSWGPAGTASDLPVTTLIQNSSIYSLSTSNDQAKAVTLNDGRVLVVSSGGNAQLFDPANAGTVAPITVTMMDSRTDASVTKLIDGRVLVAGGSKFVSNVQSWLSTAEIFDPSMNAFTLTVPMAQARSQHSATLLADGRVLIAGGWVSGNVNLQTAELFDPITTPATPTFSAAGDLVVARQQHRATLLGDGTLTSDQRVLITGGFIGGQATTAEIYVPSPGAPGTFSATGPMQTSRAGHSATRLADGTVLVAGGQTSMSPQAVVGSAEIYTPGTGVFAQAGSLLTARLRHTATLLSDGSVLLTDGARNTNTTESWAAAERYVPGAGFVGAPAPLVTRYDFGALLLAQPPALAGKVLLVGGNSGSGGTSRQAGASFEIYDPGNAATGTPSIANPNLPDGFAGVPYSTPTLVGTGGTGPYTFAVVAPSSLPSGLSLVGATITGTPATTPIPASGTYYVAVRVTDSAPVPHSSTQSLRIRIDALDITTDSLANAIVGANYSQSLTATGVGGKTWSVIAGSLPEGLSVVGAAITGTPLGTPTFANVTVKAVDSLGQIATKALSIQVNYPSLDITTASLPSVFVNAPYNQTLSATGYGTKTWTLVSGPLPGGLTLSAGGTISGTPTTAGFFNFTVRATDEALQTTTRSLSIQVNSPLTITTTTLGDGVFGSGYGGCLGANNGNGNRTWSLNTGSLPTGVTLQTDGCFSGTVGDFGTFNFTARVTDESSPPQQPVSQPLSIAVVLLADQNAGWDGGQPQLPFSGPTQIAERVVAGVSGMLSAVRISGNSICAAGTTIAAAVQGVAPNGGPDGNTVSTGIAVYPSDYFALAPPVFFAADQQFTLVFSADAACALRPLSYDSNPGEGYVYNGGWQRLRDTADARYDIPFQTLILPPPGLAAMRTNRGAHTATVLDDGVVGTLDKVLMISDQTAELYDPNDGTFTSTGNLNVVRQRHTATLLDTGDVLVTGGLNFSCLGQTCTTAYLSSAELYYPNTGTFELLAGVMTSARAQHTATKLGNGTVLITGGYTNTSTLRTAEIYTPGSQTFAATGTMLGDRQWHAAALLPGGDRVLITGGYGSYTPAQSAEIYDSTSGLFTPPAGPMQVMYRARHTATLLPASGKVLIAGGSGSSSGPTAELFDPAAGGTFASLGNMTTPRVDHTATLLADGSVLLAGGLDDTGPCCPPRAPQASVERYVPGAGFSNMGSMLVSRYSHTATFLPETGQVLLAGTWGWSSAAGRLAELFDPAAPSLASVAAPAGSNATPYAGFTLNGQGGTGPYTITLASGTLPPGLTYNSTTRTISGTPIQSGTFTVSFTVTDGSHSNTQSLTFRIDALAITTASLPTAYTGQYYATALTATGFGAKTWSHTGSLPAGLFLNASGTITGTPTASCCSFSFTVRAEDAAGQIATRNLSIYLQSPTDQQLSTQTTPAVAIPSTRRVAQVFRSGTPYDLTGVQLYSISSCSANAQITARVWPVSGAPARPDESGGTPLGIASVTAGSSGYFNGSFSFSPPIPMPQHAQFAIVVEIGPNGASCQGMNWPSDDWYPVGQGWVSDNLGAWQSSTTAIGRADIPLTTMVVPDGGMKIMSTSRSGHASATLTDGRVLLIGTDASAEIYDPVTHTLTRTAGNMSVSRYGATATPLALGKVLIVGGSYWNGTTTVALATTEIFDPANGGTFSAGPIMPVSRYRHTATLLGDGRVLIAGGDTIDVNTGYSQSLQSALLFDDTGAWLGAVDMTGARTQHSATLLPDGRVLIAGGWTGNPWPPTVAEIYDPSGGGLGAFSAVASPMTWRADHTATLLTDGPRAGQVLIAGGNGSYPDLATTSEFFDPTGLGTFSAAPGLATRRSQHTATALADGRIVIAGGGTSWLAWMPTSSVEIYDPVANQFTTVSNLLVDRIDHSVDLISVGPDAGKLVVAGGNSWSWLSARSLEVYDPSSTELAITTGALPDGIVGTAYPATTLTAAGGSGFGYTFAGVWGQLPDGLSINQNGTISGTPTPSAGGTVSFTAQVTDSASSVAHRTFTITVNRLTITSTSPLPDGVAGGNYSHQLTAAGVGAVTWAVEPGNTLPGSVTLNSSGLLSGSTPAAGWSYFNVRATDASGQSTVKGFSLQVVQMTVATAAMQTAREGHTATVLIDGRMLVAGGSANGGYLASAEVYDPTTDMWTPVGSMSETRGNHVAVRLEDGRVIVAGGNTNAGTGFTASAEIFDPATGLWAATTNLSVARARPAAVRLNNGRVLVAGGTDNVLYNSTADIFDPSSGTWSPTGSMTYGRYAPSMTMLPNGFAVIIGASNGGGQQSSEEFDPATGIWNSPVTMNDGHGYFQAVTLADGRVLVAGGSNSNGPNATTELYTSGSGWATVAGLNVARHANPLVVLPDGRAVVAGGYLGPDILASIESHDPASPNPWSTTGALLAARYAHTANRLQTGQVLVTGGYGTGGVAIASTERFGSLSLPSVSATAGGNGGTPFRYECSPTAAATGLRGRAGDDIDRTELWCAKPAPSFGPAMFADGRGSLVGGSAYALDCPANTVMVGVHGQAGNLGFGIVVDTLGIDCQDPANLNGSASYTSGTVGNVWGAPPFSLSCLAGQAVVGLYGRQGMLMDQIGLLCKVPTP